MPLPVAARFALFLLLFGAVLLSSATPATPSPAQGPTATPPVAERKVVRSWGKLRLTVKSGLGHGSHGHGRAAADGLSAGLDPQDPSKVLIKAPRRFVPKPNSPTCPDGTDADHKGNCREYW